MIFLFKLLISNLLLFLLLRVTATQISHITTEMLSSLGKGYIERHMTCFHRAGLDYTHALNPGECAPENLLSQKQNGAKQSILTLHFQTILSGLWESRKVQIRATHGTQQGKP